MALHRSFLRATLLPLLISTGLIAAPASGAQQCSNKTTEGRYLVVCDGYLSPGPNAPLLPSKVLSVATADERGTFRAANGKLSLGGTILDQSVVGTEILNADCTGTISYTQTINGQPAPALDIAFVVSHNGDKIDGISVNPGSVFSCHLTRLKEE